MSFIVVLDVVELNWRLAFAFAFPVAFYVDASFQPEVLCTLVNVLCECLEGIPSRAVCFVVLHKVTYSGLSLRTA